ncbi:unnamed protein product [Calypogeia fissa]
MAQMTVLHKNFLGIGLNINAGSPLEAAGNLKRVGTHQNVGQASLGMVSQRRSLGWIRRTLDGSDKHKKKNTKGRVQVENGQSKEVGSSRSIQCAFSEPEVEVEVEVVSWRERHIRANVCAEVSDERMWGVLTDYERLAEFIPNLVRSEKIASPTPGRVRLLQLGVQSAMYWHIEAHVVLDLEECPDAVDGKELRFSMVDGDFKEYKGGWYLRPGPRPGTTRLYYDVNVTPKLIFPAAFVEKIIRADLPVNLRALVQRAETDSSDWKNIQQPSKLYIEKAAPLPLRAVLGDKLLAVKKTCQFGRPCVVDEVHLRRLDDLLEYGGVHRRVVATITVEAPIRDVWNVLTDYERLSDFVPNLASSKIISRDMNRVQLVQEGCKCMLYMDLHACVVLDLWEKAEEEIIFQQVEGNFNSFQGKWTFEPLGSQHTLLKYVADVKMHKNCILAEAMVEEVIYVDLPTNLCAIRDFVELQNRKTVGGEVLDTETGKKRLPLQSGSNECVESKFGGKKFRIPGLQSDFRVLERELLNFILEHGRKGYMPMRSELREHKRVDLEKAITRAGGFSAVASRLKLSQQRRPRGYWDSFENLCQEIWQFQQENGIDSTHMPTRSALNKAGRADVGRALEKWGGVQEVARLMGLKSRRAMLGAPMKISSSNSSSPVVYDSTPQKPFKTSLPAKPTKWVDLKPEVSSASSNKDRVKGG